MYLGDRRSSGSSDCGVCLCRFCRSCLFATRRWGDFVGCFIGVRLVNGYLGSGSVVGLFLGLRPGVFFGLVSEFL